MAECEGIQAIVNQAGIEIATSAMMMLRDTDMGSNQCLQQALKEQQRETHGRQALEKSSFNWNALDRYTELHNFEIGVMNILEIKAYELMNKGKSQLLGIS